MCMCWSGYLSTHVSMMNSLKSNELISKPRVGQLRTDQLGRHTGGRARGAQGGDGHADGLLCHTIGGLCAGISAHWLYVLFSMFVK